MQAKLVHQEYKSPPSNHQQRLRVWLVHPFFLERPIESSNSEMIAMAVEVNEKIIIIIITEQKNMKNKPTNRKRHATIHGVPTHCRPGQR